MIALLVAKCLVERGDEVTVVSRRSGPLVADFSALARTRFEVLYRVRRRLHELRTLRALARLVDVAGALATLLQHRPELLYVNSTAASVYVHAARWLRIPVVLHVHESAVNAEGFLSEARVDSLDNVHLVACSPTIRRDLEERTGHRADVHLLPSVPDTERVRSMAGPPSRPRPDAGLVVGATGSVGHRKGTDLWLEVADVVLESRAATPSSTSSPTSFIWVGELGDPEMARPRRGVEFTGIRANPYEDMARFDVATLPSRDDPFPLVVVESMLLGKPVVAFDVGDVREQVGDGGLVVPPEDVDAFAAAVARLLDDHGLRSSMGTAARRRAEDLFSTATFSARLTDILSVVEETSPQRPRTTARQSR